MKGYKKGVFIFIMGLFALALIWSGSQILGKQYEYAVGEKEYADIEEKYVKKPSKVKRPQNDSKKEKKESKSENDPEEVNQISGVEAPEIDFAALQAANPDVVGWISFESLGISYPIMYGTDNEYYLTHTFEGKNNANGSIFVDCENAGDFSDRNTVIYGHNMKSLAMFGNLKNIGSVVEENPFFYIATPKGQLTYQIFSYYNADVGGDAYRMFYGPGKDFKKWLGTVAGYSDKDLGDIKFHSNEYVVTLSTCTTTTDHRFVVHAVLVDKNYHFGEE